MKRAKGSVLIDFVKTIRADKTGAYDSLLTAEDKEIISQRILPSAWYPFETFKRCFNAVFEVLAKKNLEQVRKWGRIYGEAIMGSIYKGLLKQGEPKEYLKKYEVYIKNFFDFGSIEVEEEGENQVLLHIKGFDPEFVPLYYMMYGWLERTLELCGAKNIQGEFVKKSWEGADETAIRFRWEM